MTRLLHWFRRGRAKAWRKKMNRREPHDDNLTFAIEQWDV
jgi:hypothetical protein